MARRQRAAARDPAPRPDYDAIIIGGGPIGCEFAHVFDAAGTKVTMVQHNVRLLPKEDPAVSAFVLKQFQRYGMRSVAAD